MANNIFENTKGQFDINLAPYAIFGLIVAAAFLVIGIILLQGIVNGAEGAVDEGSEFYDALNGLIDSIIFSIRLAPLLFGGGTAIFMLLMGAYLFLR